MNICQINDHDVANGPGVRVSVYVSGCTFKCPGCHNPEAQAFDYGEKFDMGGEAKIMNALYPHYVTGLSILGGEPLHPKNIKQIRFLCELIRMKFHYEKSIWIWTGYTAEEMLKHLEEYDTKHKLAVPDYAKDLYLILQCADVIVEGRYIESKRDLKLKFRGSSNQRIIDANALITDKKIKICEEYMN